MTADKLEQAATDHGALHRQNTPAEAVALPETVFEDPGYNKVATETQRCSLSNKEYILGKEHL